MSWVITVVVFLLLISALVAAHEYGHFLFARLCGMEVEEFAIGMGKPSWTFMRKKGTEYNLRAFPVGGFVRIKGMIPQEDGSEVNIENGFYSKSPYKRFLVLFAGPLFSILAGVIILMILFTTVGEPVKTATLGDMIVGDPGEKAGLKPGDLVLSINGTKMSTWNEMVKYIHSRPNQTVDMDLDRDGKEIHKTVTIGRANVQIDEPDSQGMPTGKKDFPGMIGVAPPNRIGKLSFGDALEESLVTPVEAAKGVALALTHPAVFNEAAGGPGTMLAVTHDASTEGTFGHRIYETLLIAAILSINLGFMNLLPVVPLDGGQMMVAFAEMFKKRRLSMQIQSVVTSVGFALVATLVLCVLWVDFKRYVIPEHTPKLTISSQPAQPVKPAVKGPAPVKQAGR